MHRLSTLWIALSLILLVTVPLHASSDDDAVPFFENHAGEIDFKETATSLLFSNRQVGIELRKAGNGLQLHRIYGIESHQDLLTPSSADKPRELFTVRMAVDPKYLGRDDRGKTEISLMGIMDEPGLDAFSIDSFAAKSLEWRCEPSDGESTLHLEWKGMDAKESEGMIDVHVTIRLRANDPLSYWRINVRNRGTRYGIERVLFPIIPLAPIGAADENVLIYPQSRGRMIQGPFKDHKVQGFYSCDFEMQFQALYNRSSKAGVYLATQQTVPCISHLLIDCKPDEITWINSHFPKNMTFAQDAENDIEEDFPLSYDVVVGPFSGDWYDACQIYREWAVKQSWCAKGPVSQRKDIPQWYLNSPLYFYTVLNDSVSGTHSMAENLRIAADDFSEWLKWADMKLPLNLYAWEQPVHGMSVKDVPFHAARSQLLNKTGRWSGMTGHNFYDGNYPAIGALSEFSSILAGLKEQGGMVCPYVAVEMFNPGPSENAPYTADAKAHAVRDLFGAIRIWGSDGAWQMCSSSQWWRDRLKETCLLLLTNENAGGIYLDVMRGSNLPCFWIAHGHTAAGADSMTTPRHDMVAYLNDAVKKQNPDAIITGENPSENMIDTIDGMLVYSMWPDHVPLLATVYQDYIRRYGLELSVGPGYRNRFGDIWDDNAFFIETASLFTEGAQIGRIRLKPRESNLSVTDPSHKEMVDFLGKVVARYKHDISRNYLVYGQLRRPLTFTTPSTMPMIAYKPGGEFAALMSGVFRTDDGSIGIFIANASRDNMEFSTTIDRADYSLPDGNLIIQRVSADGGMEDITHDPSKPITLTGDISGHDIVMFRIVASK